MTHDPPVTTLSEPIHRASTGVDVLDAIYDRRATRAYTERALTPREVRALIDAAIQAPSAVNQQPWAFLVIQTRDLLRRISDRAKQLTRARLEPGSVLWEHRALLEDPRFDVFHGASTAIVVCAAPAEWPANEDCCLAAQNLMLAAHGLGLATCPVGFAREALGEPSFRRELGIPDDHAVVMPIAVGTPRERPARTPRREARILSWH